MLTADRGLWCPVARVEKFAHADLDRLGLLAAEGDEIRAAGLVPYESVESVGNLLLNSGINRLLSLLIGAGGQALTATYCRLGVGDGSAAAVATQTDLQGSNKYFKSVDAGYPNVSTAQTLTVQSTYDTNTANFAWNEWGIDWGGAGSSTSGATVGTPILNRKVPSPSLGTKTSGTWVLTVTVVLA